MSKLFTTICISLLLVTFTPSVVRADPIEITSGFYTVLRFQPGGSHFNLVGTNFVVTGGGAGPGSSGPAVCFACFPGAIIPMDTIVGLERSGVAIIDGRFFPNLTLIGQLEISGDPLVIPNSSSNVVLTAPFTASGFIAGCSNSFCDTPPVFTTELTGSGVAIFELTRFLDFQGRPFFSFARGTYVFGPIPEPASIVLLTSGLAAIGAAKLKRRRSRSKTRSRD
jgi:hypothetical protein